MSQRSWAMQRLWALGNHLRQAAARTRGRDGQQRHWQPLEMLEPRRLLSVNVIAGGDVSGTWIAGDVYVLQNDVRVPSGSTLTIEAGAVVKPAAYYVDINVEGTLNANGNAEEKVIITSYLDDSAGGDTNANGESVGGVGQWGAISILAGGAATLNYTDIRFGGNGVGGELIASGGSLTLSNSIISSSYTVGLRIAGANPTLTDNTWQNNVGAALSMDLASNPAISGVTMTSNGLNGLAVDSGTLSGNQFWDDAEVVYRLDNDVTVAAGASLTIGPGQIVKLLDYYVDLLVNGTLTANGSSEAPIIFTGNADDTAGGDSNNNGVSSAIPGQWGALRFAAGSTASVLDFVQVRNGGNSVAGQVIVDGGALTMSNSTIERSYGPGLRIANASPTLSDNTVQNNNGVAISMDLASSPEITGTTLSGNSRNAVLLDSGSITGDQSWANPQIVYLLSDDVTIPAAASLTIAPGQVIKMPGYYAALIVNGTLSAAGASAQPIIITSLSDDTAGGDSNNDGSLTSPAAGHWGQIQFNTGSTGNLLDYVQTRYGGYGAAGQIIVDGAALTMSNSVIANSASAGTRITNADPTLTDNTWQSNTSYALSMDLASSPVIAGVTMAGNGRNSLAVDSGTLSGNRFWDDPQIVYELINDVTVEAGASLTIGAGQVIKMPGYWTDLLINGTLSADGSAEQPIIITSVYDDSAGGDTNNDGTATSAAAAQWGLIQFNAGSTANLLDNVQTRYGGYGGLGQILVNGGPLTMSNSVVASSAGVGLRILGADPTLTNNTWQNNGNYALAMDLASSPAISGVTMSNNVGNALLVLSGTLTGDKSWNDPDIVYVLSDDVIIDTGASLTIAPGQVIKMPGYYADLTVNGALSAAGTAQQPIVFTSLSDDTVGGDSNNNGSATGPGPGEWGRIQFNAGSGDNLLDNVQIRYGGYNWAAQVITDGGALTLSNSTVANSSSAGLRIIGANPTLTSNTFANNVSYALSMDLASNPVISGAAFSNNAVNGLFVDGGTITGSVQWDDPEVVYWLWDDVTIAEGGTLTVSPGQIVKMADYWVTINVNGALVADGSSAQPIVFTSSRDDSVGGDTRNDGSTTGLPGQWGGITLGSTSSGNVLDFLQLRYGGYGVAALLAVNGATASISNSLLGNSSGHGIAVSDSGELTVSSSLIVNHGHTGFYVAANSRITAINNTVDGNYRGAHAQGGILTLHNNLITFNSNGGVILSDGGTAAVRYSDLHNPGAFYGNYFGMTDPTGTDGNVSLDPTYVNRTLGVYDLLSNAPVLDSADGDEAPSTDYKGNPRFDDSGVDNLGVGAVTYADLGAIERQNQSDPRNLIISAAQADSANLTIGQSLSISWTVSNDSVLDASGNWNDLVFASTDAVWDIGDTLVASVPHADGLAVGQSYDAQTTLSVPAAPMGTLYFIVRADGNKLVRESNESDNDTLVTSELTVPELTTSTPISGQFAISPSAVYYRITPTAGATLLLTLERSGAGASEIYVKKVGIPTLADFDARSQGTAGPDQELTIADTEATVYYVMVRNSAGSADAFTLSAELLPYSVRSVSPATLGTAGFVTILVKGAQFGENDQVTLVGPGGTLEPEGIEYRDSASLYATFDLTGRAAGVYTVAVDDGAGSNAQSAVTVDLVAASSEPTTVRFIRPSFLRRGSVFAGTLEIRNDTQNDQVLPLVTLDSNDKANLGFSPTALYNTSISVVPRSNGGPLGLLRPGETWSLPIYGKLLATADSPVTFSVRQIAASDTPVANDIVSQLFSLPLEEMFAGRAAEMQAYLDTIIGATNFDFVRSIHYSADRIRSEMPDAGPLTIEDVFRTQLQMAFHIVEYGLMDQYYADNDLPYGGEGGAAILASKAFGDDVSAQRSQGGLTGAGTSIETRYPGSSGRVRYVSAGFTASEDYDNGPHWVNDMAAELHNAFPNDTIKVVAWNAGTGGGMVASIAADAAIGAAAGSAIPGLGTGLGALGGAILGGVGYYWQKANRTEEVGRDIANDVRNGDVDPGNVYLYGHSLGAHAMGYAGRELGGNVAQIVGFDPAGELFGVDPKDRLDPTDARNVQAIHTSSSFGHLGLFGGSSSNIGDENYYPAHLRWGTGAHGYSYEWYLQRLRDLRDRGDDPNTEPDLRFVPVTYNGPPPNDGDPNNVRNGLSPDGSNSDGSDIVQSIDPNDIQGPGGYGADGFLLPGALLPYLIRFENDPEHATAPAQIVTISNTLDADMDFTTFELGAVGFGATVVTVPAGLSSYSTDVDSTNQDGSALRVHIEADFNAVTGVANWIFSSLDPATGMAPFDAFAGFLPVDDDTGRGEGFVSYRIYAKNDLATATRLDNAATIVFDENPAINTPAIYNTIDADGPSSAVTALAAISRSTAFTVSWAGADGAGSGVAGYDVFVSDNDADYTAWLTGTTQTSGSYTGQDGHSYRFYSVASDNLAFVEAAPAPGEPDAQTTVDENDPPALTTLTLDPEPIRRGSSVTFTAAGTDGDGSVSSVEFFLDANGNSVADEGESLGEDADSSGGFTLTTAASWAVGSYTVLAIATDNEGGQSEPLSAQGEVLIAGITVTVGDGSAKSVKFTDGDGSAATVAVKSGLADLTFTGDDLVQTTLRGITTVTGTNIELAAVDLVTTSALASLTFTAKGGNNLIDIGEIVITGSLKTLAGKNVDLTGDLTVTGGLSSLTLHDVGGDEQILLDIAGAGVPLTATLAAVGDVSLSSVSAIKALTVGQWSDENESADLITAPSLGKLSTKGDKLRAMSGDFAAGLTLDGADGALTVLASATFTGTITAGVWTIGGPVGAVKAKASAALWEVDIEGAVKSLDLADGVGGMIQAASFGTIKSKGGISGIVTATQNNTALASFGAITAGAVVDGQIKAQGSIKSIKAASWTGGAIGGSALGGLTLAGNMSADLDLTGAASGLTLGNVTIKGIVDSAQWRINGNAGMLTLGLLRDSQILLGVDESLETLPTAVEDFTLNSTLAGLTIKGIVGVAEPSFVRSVVAAWAIGKASLRQVDNANGGDETGLAANTVASYSRISAAGTVKLSRLDAAGDQDVDGDYLLRVL